MLQHLQTITENSIITDNKSSIFNWVSGNKILLVHKGSL